MNKKNISHFSRDLLYHYLKFKRYFSASEVEYFTNHLNNCQQCWKIWNEVRWDLSFNSEGVNELNKYLGSSFVPYFDSSWAIAKDWCSTSPKSETEISEFYKNCHHYLYNLTIWDESGDKDINTEDIHQLVSAFSISSVIDFGCGVGVDGLKFMDLGVKVVFVDFENPSTKFLKWRLKQRKMTAQVLDVEKLETYPVADAFWAIDVLEHMVDPTETVRKLHQSTRLFIHRSEFSNTSGGRHPCHLPFEEVKLAETLKKHGFHNVPWNTVSVWVRD